MAISKMNVLVKVPCLVAIELDKKIENLRESCCKSLVIKQSPPSVPLHPGFGHLDPWHKLHINFAALFMNSYVRGRSVQVDRSSTDHIY